MDDSLADFEESVNFFNFSVDHAPHVSLNQPFEVLHQENSRSNNNRHFDKQHRKRSYRRGSHQSDRLHPTHHPIDLSGRTDTLVDEINLLSKGPSFVPYLEILIGINADKTGRHLLTKCDGQIFTLIANILTL